MTRGIPRVLVNLLMAAAVLAWSMAPPPVQHSHKGGADLSHHHDSGDHDRAQADSSVTGHSVSDWGLFCPAAVAEGIGGDASHFHFRWLGFRLTLPDDDSPAQKGENQCPSQLLFVRDSRSSAPQVSLDKGLNSSVAVPSLNAIVAGADAFCPPVVGSHLRLTPHPLCDRARHERSGVLLA